MLHRKSPKEICYSFITISSKPFLPYYLRYRDCFCSEQAELDVLITREAMFITR